MLNLIKNRSTLSTYSKFKLINLVKEIPKIAELTQCPIFVDLIEEKSGIAYVLAEAHPQRKLAFYSKPVVGNYAYKEDEPAVYKALQTGLPETDSKAITQEKRIVLQNVLPIDDDSGQYFAALIMERDITDNIIREEKLKFLSTYRETQLPLQLPTDINKLLIRESYHRIKNDLQFLASQCRIRAHKAKSIEARKMMLQNVNSILTISTLYDTITMSADMVEVDACILLQNLAYCISNIVGGVIEITVEGAGLLLQGEAARTIAITTNELICNSLQHGREGDQILRIKINVSKGHLFHTITVTDNGCGLEDYENSEGIGLEILSALVANVLDGTLRLFDTGSGVSAVIQFPS